MRGGFIVVLMSVFVVITVVGSMLVPVIDNISTDDGWDETINTVFNENPAEILLSRQNSNFSLSISVVNDGSDLTITNGDDTVTAALAPQFILATDSSSVFVNDQNDVVCIWTDSTGTHDMILFGDFTAAIANDKLTITENGNDTDLPLPAEYLYYPSSTGWYGSFTSGDLTKRPVDPLIAAGSFGDICAYNLKNTYADYIVQSAIVSQTSITSVEWIGGIPEQNEQLLQLSPDLNLNPDPLIIQPLNPGVILMGTPPTPTYTDGDWGYNLDADNNAIIVSYSGSAGNIIIPSTVGSYPVKAVGIGSNNQPIFDNTSITNSTVTVPVGVEIKNYAFADCTNIVGVTLTGVSKIGSYAFRSCTGLTTVTIDSVTVLSISAFQNCTGLISVSVAANTIGVSAFRGCTNLSTLNLNEGVSNIGSSAFRDCTALTSITLPSTVISIQNDAFRDCTNLSTVNLNEGLDTAGGFQGCTALTSITLPSTCTKFSNDAFRGCTNLSTVNLNEGLDTIGTYAFSGCTALTSITMPYSLTTINGNAFVDCINLSEVKLNYGFKSIGLNCFKGCSSLTTIVIPSTVVTINNNVFLDSGVQYVLNLSDFNITPTSYGLNGAEVRTSIDAAAYIAPATLHKTYHHMGIGEFMGEILPILPLIIIAATLIIAAGAVIMRRN